ncbi:uncharacterized protein LOC114363836 [Ostrinia furnacalis]|uniref:uncharacterized protein LOC114363836 n=1 Tax=Ostrinia furnacalis TaxID=93504 RepID=UPI00103CD620|nr:uncharacterized protein LOC114363836 [Ostrinia furnacalis]
MFTCASCGVQHTDGPTCSACRRHYDFQCSGITESGYRKLGDRKNTWRCLKCKSSSSPSPATSSLQQSSSQLDQMQEQLKRITTQLVPLASLVEDIKQIKNELTNVKDSLELAHELINSFSDKVKSLDAKIVSLEKVANEVPTLRSEVNRLNLELQDRDQRDRANNIEIRGIPQGKSENLYEIVQKIGNFNDYAIKKEDINYIARVPTRVPKIEKPIIVSFYSRYTKENYVAASRKKKQNKLSDVMCSVFEGRVRGSIRT